VWAAGGLIGRLGAAKRRMLSLAEMPSPVDVAAWGGGFPWTAAAEGIVAGYASIDGLELRFIEKKTNCAKLSVEFQTSDTVLSQSTGVSSADVRTQPEKSSWSSVGASTRGCGRWDASQRGSREQGGYSPYGCNAVLGTMQNAGMNGERFAKREMQLAILSEVWALTLAVLRSPARLVYAALTPSSERCTGSRVS
jgi:hypothetical protein